jgi:putative transposase
MKPSASLDSDADRIARTDDSCAGDAISQRASQLASKWFVRSAHNDVEAFLTRLPITIGGKPIDDPYAEWHPNTTDFGAMSRAHLLRIYHDWKHETALHGYLADEPRLVDEIGFDSLPNQSTLYEAWHKRFSEKYRDELTQTVETVIEIARDNGVNVPDHAFRLEEKRDEELSARAQRRLARHTAKEVWQAAKPLVGPVVDFDRPDDTEIHDNAFLELHTYLGCRSDLYAETGAVDFIEDTTRERTPTGSYHRNCIRQLSIEQQRRNHRRAMTEVIARARQEGELTGKQTAAIDITEGDLFYGTRGTEALKKQILGTKEHNQEVAYQYATVQIVGHDIPFVLDGVPVIKGMPRAEIVDELLNHTTDMVNIDLLLMDREFGGDAIKDVCDEYGVYYLNRTRMFSAEKRTAQRLAREDTSVHVETDAAADGPPRKRLWVPKADIENDEMLPDGGTEINTDSAAEDESAAEQLVETAAIRDQLGEEFLAAFGDEADEETVDWALGSKFLETAEEMAYKESYAVSSDGIRHVMFETNHPELDVSDDCTEDDETAVIHLIARFTRQYAHRWGIENGYKKIKSFMAETTSKDHRYRFFNFIFACLLYSLWRLVDLLVKRSLVSERAEPRVRASTFLTIAKQEYGLDPPE